MVGASGSPSSGGAIVSRLRGAGVGSGVYYPVPVHRQPAYRAHSAASCPDAERAADDMLSIPVHHSLSDAEVEAVAAAVGRL